jgi:hypothetical protein
VIKVSIWQHLLHTEREFIKYLSNAGFKISSDYEFESIWDDEDNCDGGKLIFDINKTDLPTLINAVKKIPVDFIQLDQLDHNEDLEDTLYCSYD